MEAIRAYEAALRGGSRGAPSVVMHPELLGPVPCQNCGNVEDLPAAPVNRHVVVPDLPPLLLAGALNLLRFERPSCFWCVKEMYEKTGHAARVGRGGDTPLHHAARCGNLRSLYHLIVLLFQRDGGVVHDVRGVDAVTMCNDNGETALHTAVSVGSIEIVQLLMWVHPQLGNITCANISPMYLAVSLGHRDIAQALYDASRNPNPTDISYSGPNRQNALHAAALLDGDDMTEMILTWNKDLAKEKDEKGRTPLHFAVSVLQLHSIRICYFPFRRGKAVSVTRILEADSLIAYEMDNEGFYPIHLAAQTNQWFFIDIMLERCPECMGLRDNQGRTFLHVAVQNNAVGVVSRACRRQEFAPILNIQDKNGNTALHLAVDVQNLLLLRFLLMNRKVLLNLRNKEGDTALDLAKRRIRECLFFAGDSGKLIYGTLERVGAQHGRYLWDDELAAKPDTGRPASGLAERTPEEDLEKDESAKLAESTRSLGLGTVLIASVTFAAATSRVTRVSGDTRSSSQAVGMVFDAFIVANALAFIFAASATVGLMYSGMATLNLRSRRLHYNVSGRFASYSVTCMAAAFILGMYMELAPHAPAASIWVSYLCLLLLVTINYRQSLGDHALGSVALCARRGILIGFMSTCWNILLQILFEFWPVGLIAGVAIYRIR